MAPKVTNKGKPAVRSARRASSAKPKKAVPYVDATPTTGDTSPFITTTTSQDAPAQGRRSSRGSGDDKKATPVPIKLIKGLQQALLDQKAKGALPKDRSYSQDELKNILNLFWDTLKQELIHGEGHKVSLMNYMTFRLVFRDGQKFTPPKNGNSLKSPEEVIKPPRWNLSVNIKDKLKQELQDEFARAHGDIVRAYGNDGRSVKSLAARQGLIKLRA